MSNKGQKPATIAARAFGAIDPATAGVVPGIHTATTYMRDRDNVLIHDRNSYARDDNDTVRTAEVVLRELEGAAETLLLPSGMAAAAAVLRAVPKGGRVLLQAGIYYGVTHLARTLAERGDVTLEEVDTADTDALRAALSTQADLLWIEVPSNPWLKVTDIAKAASLAKGAGALLAVDGTASTPVLTRALDLGADISMHSVTKAINGHSDVVGGALSCANPDLPIWSTIRADRHDAGAILGPFEAWLALRGMRTLPLRMERMCVNAETIALHLEAHERIEAVLYPGLEAHPGHAIAARQMCGGFGYLMSFIVKGGAQAALDMIGKLALIHRATSLGGVESLIEHRATIEPGSGIPGGLLRLSVGIEDVQDLILDVTQALEQT